jgi:hypothetical protein
MLNAYATCFNAGNTVFSLLCVFVCFAWFSEHVEIIFVSNLKRIILLILTYIYDLFWSSTGFVFQYYLDELHVSKCKYLYILRLFRGHAVVLLIKVLYYNQEGRMLDSRCGQRISYSA